MKRTYLLVLMMVCIVVMGCTACEKNGAANKESESNEKQTLETIELCNTYTTQFAEVNKVTFPTFKFDYPSNWNIVSESVDSQSERVELSNDGGVTIRYEYIVPAYAYGGMSIENEVENIKVADSNFIAGYAQTEDYSDLGKFMIAKVKTISIQDLKNEPEPIPVESNEYYYALKPESESGVDTVDGNFITAFWYDGLLQFMADIPENFSAKEEQEVIDILSSFSVSDSKKSDTVGEKDKVYTELQKGNFSYFAGTYKACGIYDEWYGGGEHLPDLSLQKDGRITGGLVYASYPKTRPTTVTKNDDGSYLCQVTYSSDTKQDYFLIYPKGVIGKNPYVDDDPFLTKTPYIQYISMDGDVIDIIYYKVEE